MKNEESKFLISSFLIMWWLVVGLLAPRVLVTDGLALEAKQALEARGAVIKEEPNCMSELEEGLLAEFDAVIVRSATSLSARALTLGSKGKLRVVGRAGIGVDNIDMAGVKAAKVWLLNSAGASATSVVELTLAHLLATARSLPRADRALRRGEWLKGKLSVPHELRGKKLGLIGFGDIAQGVAKISTALGMSVSATSPNAKKHVADSLGVELVANVDELFSSCTHVR